MATEQTSTFLTWTPPGETLEIHLDYSVIERMVVEVMRGFGVTRRRGTESGGLLIGKIDRRAPRPVIHIQDFEVVPCEYASGPSYILSDNDRKKFQEAIARWQPSLNRDLYSIGYFRSHTRDGFALDRDDAVLFRDFFHDPLDVVLLIKPYATRPATAGFFLQEHGHLITGGTPLEFEFAPPKKGRFTPEPEPHAERHQVVPSPIEPPPAPAPKPKPVATPAPTRPLFADQMAEPSAWRRRLSWTIFSAALAAFGGACGYEYANSRAAQISSAPMFGKPSNASPAALAGPYSVNLQVSQSGDSLMIKWNRQAIAIEAAKNGLLTITEGQNSKEVKLDPSELKNGTAMYPHVGQDVRFRLELFLRITEATWSRRSSRSNPRQHEDEDRSPYRRSPREPSRPASRDPR